MADGGESLSLGDRIKRYALAVLIALDVLLATIVFGTEQQTISEVAGLASRQGASWGGAVCVLLEVIEPDHCEMVLQRAGKG
jgi:hypothetical protein